MADPDAPNFSDVGQSFLIPSTYPIMVLHDNHNDDYDGRYPTKVREGHATVGHTTPSRKSQSHYPDSLQNKLTSNQITVPNANDDESVHSGGSTLFYVYCPNRSDDDTISQIPDHLEHLGTSDFNGKKYIPDNSIRNEFKTLYEENDFEAENGDQMNNVVDEANVNTMIGSKSLSFYEEYHTEAENGDKGYYLEDEGNDVTMIVSKSLSLYEGYYSEAEKGDQGYDLDEETNDDTTIVSKSFSLFPSDKSYLFPHTSLKNQTILEVESVQTSSTEDLQSSCPFNVDLKSLSSTKNELACLCNPVSDFIQSQSTLLRQEGFPLGLIQQLEWSRVQFPFRYWMVDNSINMQASDCHQIRIVESLIKSRPKSSSVITKCTRWAELQSTISDHAELAGLLHMPSMFRFLNDPGASLRAQECLIAFSSENHEIDSRYDDVKALIRTLQEIRPNGATPLTSSLVEIKRRIEVIQSELRKQERTAVVIIVTGGLPTDDNGDPSRLAQYEFIKAIQSLQALPVSIVIRLCTTDEHIVSFYKMHGNDNKERVHVLNDFLTQCRQIYRCNSWLNYALPLHRCRELGCYHPLFDILNERALKKVELLEFLKLLLGIEQFGNAPDIYTEWKEFKAFLMNIIESEKKHWSPISRKMEYWIDVRCLDKMYGTSRQFTWSVGTQKVEAETLQISKTLTDAKKKGMQYVSSFWKRK